MKKLIIIVSCLCMLLVSFSASALDVSDNEKVNEFISSQISENEISEIDLILLEQEGSVISESNVTNNDSMLNSHDINNIYKVYKLPILMVTAYNENPTLDSLLTDECVWEVYAKSMLSDNSLAQISEINGAKEFSGIGVRTDSYITNQKIAAAIEQGGLSISEIKEIKIAKSDIYHSYFAFVITEATDYVIAFPSQEDYLGIETGKLYTVAEMMETMYEIFDEEKLLDNPNSNGGVPIKEVDNTNVIVVLVVVASIAVITTAIILINKKKFVKN